MKLTDILNDTNQRIGALESSDFNDAAGIARISKVYGDIKITAVITASIHTYPVCSETLYCSESLII